MTGTPASPDTDPDAALALRDFLAAHPPRSFDRGETLIHNTRHQSGQSGISAGGSVAYVVEGLVRGGWNRPFIAPRHQATTIVAGDGRWVGVDAFKYGANLFLYEALTLTTATVVPLSFLVGEAPRALLVHALRCVSLDWCATSSVQGLGRTSLERRTILLLYNLFRLHPRAEIEVRERDVAELLGVARQSLHPVLKRLEQRGLVALGYGEILVGEADALLAELRAPATRVRAGKPRRKNP